MLISRKGYHVIMILQKSITVSLWFIRVNKCRPEYKCIGMDELKLSVVKK